MARSPKMVCCMWWKMPGRTTFSVYFSVCRQIERSSPGALPLRVTTRNFRSRLPGDPLPQASMKAGSSQPVRPAAIATSTGPSAPVSP
ncbi:hypothetical protein D3C87_1926700 [compost metagenome]